MNYAEAREKIGFSDSVRIKNNVNLISLGNGVIGYMLHQTHIIKYHPDGTIILNNGGWRTIATRDSMNDGLNLEASVYSRQSDWLVRYKGKEYMYVGNTVTLNPDGTTDAPLFAIYEIGNACEGVTIKTIDDIKAHIEAATLIALKALWRKCKYSKDTIAYYAPLKFLPLIYPRATGEEYWYPAVSDRLANG